MSLLDTPLQGREPPQFPAAQSPTAAGGLTLQAQPSGFEERLLNVQPSEMKGSLTKKSKNNDIRPLVKPTQVRLVNLDLDSPRMAQAMRMLGYEKEDLNTRKRREQFRLETDIKQKSPQMRQLLDTKELQVIDPEDVEEELVSLRFKHY